MGVLVAIAEKDNPVLSKERGCIDFFWRVFVLEALH